MLGGLLDGEEHTTKGITRGLGGEHHGDPAAGPVAIRTAHARQHQGDRCARQSEGGVGRVELLVRLARCVDPVGVEHRERRLREVTDQPELVGGDHTERSHGRQREGGRPPTLVEAAAGAPAKGVAHGFCGGRGSASDAAGRRVEVAGPAG